MGSTHGRPAEAYQLALLRRNAHPCPVARVLKSPSCIAAASTIHLVYLPQLGHSEVIPTKMQPLLLTVAATVTRRGELAHERILKIDSPRTWPRTLAHCDASAA